VGYIDDFIAEADKDNRIGDHEAILAKVEGKTWPDGQPFTRLSVSLPAAGMATADCNIQPIPSEEALKAIKAEGNAAKMKGVASGIQLVRQLEQHYGTADPARLTVGSKVCVKTVKTKVTENPITGAKKGGFIRIIAFLPPGSVKAAAETPTSAIPF